MRRGPTRSSSPGSRERHGPTPAKGALRGAERHAVRERAVPTDSERTVGLRAGLAIFAARPKALRRVAYSAQIEHELEALVRHCKARGVPCVQRAERDLEHEAETPLHEGLCVWAEPRTYVPVTAFGERLRSGGHLGIALDRVRNPYNVGAILRSAAFLGARGVLFGAQAPFPGLVDTAVRVAEGGVEHLLLSRSTDLADSLERLRASGIAVIGAAGEGATNAIDHAFGGPTVIVFGNEREGLHPRVREACDALLAIPGTNAVESLNVGVAAGILIAEARRPALRTVDLSKTRGTR